MNTQPLIFKKWNLTAEQINQMTTKIKTEFIGNPYYLLTDEEQKELEEEKQRHKEIQQETNDSD